MIQGIFFTKTVIVLVIINIVLTSSFLLTKNGCNLNAFTASYVDNIKSNRNSNSYSNSKLSMTKDSEDFADPYDDLMDFNKVIDDNLAPIIKEQNSLLIPESNSAAIDKYNKSNQFKVQKRVEQQWELWDDFMEEQFGDLDAELTEEDMWMSEMRTIVEQKRGMAIWSKKSDAEIQEEVKKSLANKSVPIPRPVRQLVTSVFLERLFSMREYKQFDELAFVEFRKWMLEQRKKLKKDPLPVAKVEVSKAWLLRSPFGGLAEYGRNNKAAAFARMIELMERKANQKTLVVLDEVTDLFTMSSKAPTSLKLPPDQSTIPPTNNIGGTNSPANAPLNTLSVKNWDKSYSEFIQSTASDSIVVSNSANNNDSNSAGLFQIDDHSMFVANKANDEYYVVL